jgi:general nucleoside transport system permease protein
VSAFGAILLALVTLTLIKATPLIFAALGGVLSERAGIVNIALEGIMIAGAFTAVCVSGATGNPVLGAVAGVVAGALLAAILAFVATRLAFDQIVAGTGCNIVALGGAAFGLVLVFGQPGASREVPAFGETGAWVLTILAFVLAGALSLFLERTPWGLRIRACGENPHAAASAGIDPLRTRFWAVVTGGAIASLGGVFLALGELDLYSDGMTAGRGFIALAAFFFGAARPWPTAAAAFLFGLVDAIQVRLPGSTLPPQIVDTLPYIAVIVALTALGIVRTRRGGRAGMV